MLSLALALAAISAAHGQDIDNSCVFANDGSCDEPEDCQVGTDTTDCGASAAAAPPPESAPGDDSCVFANDGMCHDMPTPRS